MHVSSKDSSKDGRSHVVSSVVEADGPFELVRADQSLLAKVVNVARTASGGLEVAVEVQIQDAAPIAAEPAPSLAADSDPNAPVN